MSSAPRIQTRRPALGEATVRVNNTQPNMAPPAKMHPANIPHHESRKQRPTHPTSRPPSDSSTRRSASANPAVPNPRLSDIRTEEASSKRDSQVSTDSSRSRMKICVGPWRLGKTLGEGATARVRLAKHMTTGQLAAVKIIAKQNAILSQAGSLANLEKADLEEPADDGIRRMPVGIEREVAIMKLIQHPNIMKLYDIWENRTEIYLVLEYLQNGELFDRISSVGRLSELEAMKYFRQLISALGYCHSFNICHRDLKPENILVSGQGDVKIADFGMAALQQGPDYKLRTSCGSPHYAAPELIKGETYRGNLVDIWSMGVIFYAMLCGRLPFDAGETTSAVQPTLELIKKGKYPMPTELSPEAQSMIRHMLQVKPRDRITIPQIWRHRLMQKYDSLDDLGHGNFPQSPNSKDLGHPVSRRSDICKDLVRQLRSMWHRLSEEEIITMLLNDEPNEQKLFYALLNRHREAQLENYVPELEYSNSDYHHVRPTTLPKTYSTRHFSQNTTSKGHVRHGSKFTVISNSADTEKSYDPFKASRPQRLSSIGAGARITIHRNDYEADIKGNATRRQLAMRSSKHLALPAPPRYQTRSSLASSVKSGTSGGYVRAASRYKRGVSFNHLRVSGSSLGSPSPARRNGRRHSNHTEVTDDGGDVLRPVSRASPSARYIRSKKAGAGTPSRSPAKKAVRTSLIWGEDVRQLSRSLAKDCDEAFNRISVITDEDSTSRLDSDGSLNSKHNSRHPKSKMDDRPLPPRPARTESVKIELEQQRLQFELRKELEGASAQGHLDRMVNHLDGLLNSPTSATDRRTSSAPQEGRQKSRQLASINEAGEQASRNHRAEAKNGRVASAPEPRDITRAYQYNSSLRDTIRVVPPSDTQSPVKMPAPLTIRKKSSQTPSPSMPSQDSSSEWESCYSAYQAPTLSLRQQFTMGARGPPPGLTPITERHYDEDTELGETASNAGTIVRKKSGWFKRNSRNSDETRLSAGSDIAQSINKSSDALARAGISDRSNTRLDKSQLPLPPLPLSPKKKKGIFGKLFKKTSKTEMKVADHDIYEDEASLRDSMANIHKSYVGRIPANEDAGARQIAPRQNWIAKLFHVKPPARYLCFATSQRTARKEIVTVFRDWKKYGMRDIQVDKSRNIVFAKVGAKNYLDIKEVSIAAEIMTVIEHGKRSHLSIVRFTQEQGAGSSFNKVLDTLENVLHVKHLLITDGVKAKRMIKTLTSN